MTEIQADPAGNAPGVETRLRLGQQRRGFRGVVVSVGHAGEDLRAQDADYDLELERRLLEIGLVEGATVEILHEGLLGRDPIALQVDSMRVAVRRKEANTILVRALPERARPGRGTR